jgi:hypothetical protein
MTKQDEAINEPAADQEAEYLRVVLRERERLASLFVLQDAGWHRDEIVAGVAAISGLVRLPHVSANDSAADMLESAGSACTAGIGSRTWKRRVGQVRRSPELALALFLLRREMSADNDAWRRELDRTVPFRTAK